MTLRQQIQEIPAALRTTLEKARAQYGAVIRKMPWSEGPVLVCGVGECSGLGHAAVYPFESFAGWPVLVRPAEVFQSYALPLLKQHSVLILISGEGEYAPAVELAETARKRGTIIINLTNSAEGALAKVSDHVLLAHVAGADSSPAVSLCLFAALNFLAFEAAHLLKRPESHWSQVAEEFERMPEKIDWSFTQLSALVRSFAGEVSKAHRVTMTGAGFYHFPAERAAWQLRSIKSPRVSVVEATDLPGESKRAGETALFVSSSQSKLRKLIHHRAEEAREGGARVLALTDGNDRSLVEASDLSLLVPTLQEAPHSVLSLFMLEWLATEVVRATKQSAA